MRLRFFNTVNLLKHDAFVWTPMMIDIVQENYKDMNVTELAQAMGVGLSAMRTKLYEMGFKKMEMEYWTEEQTKFLLDNYKTIGDKELAILFNGLWEKDKRWSFKHMEKKRLYLKLKRTPEELAAIKIRNTDRGCWMDTGTWETRGEAPDGTVRIWKHSWPSKRGTVWREFKVIKVDGVYFHYARWLYEKTFGPMPAGYVTGFKDRDNMNVVSENLEAITRAEHARRNRIKYPEEIMELEKILTQLNNTLKQKKNEHKK